MSSPRLAPALALCVLVSAFPLFAKSPTIIVNGDPPLNFTVVTSDSFGFGADALGGGDFGFTNATGQTWTELNIYVTLPSFESITCGSVSFVTCTVTTTTPAGSSPASYDLIFGPDPVSGIANRQNFTIDLNDNAVVNQNPAGAGSWGPGTDFTAVANAPEPAAFALGFLGLLSLFVYLVLGSVRVSKRRSKAAY